MASTTKNSSFTGRCLCGAVEIVFSPEEGQEAKCAFCHCHSCQRWYMNPVSVDVMLHEAAPGQGFKLTGELIEDVRTLPTHKTVRLRCSSCKSPVGCKWQMNDAPSDKWGWAFPVALFALEEGQGLPAGFPKPTHHCWYKNRTVDVKDGLPKWASWPSYSEQIPE